MIHELRDPIRGDTHARITVTHLAPNSGGFVAFQLGTVEAKDAGRVFAPDLLIPEIKRTLTVGELDAVRGTAAKAGAPAGEFRLSDLCAYLDAAGWPTLTVAST